MSTDKNKTSLNLLFPTIVGVADCSFHKTIEKPLVKHCLQLKKKNTKGMAAKPIKRARREIPGAMKRSISKQI